MQPQQQQRSFAESIQLSLLILWFMSGPAALIARKPGTSGHRFWGLAIFLSALAPLVIAQGTRSGVVTTEEDLQQQSLCVTLSGVLVFLWLFNKLASLKNKGSTFSLDVGVTRFCNFYRPLVELAIVFGVAYGVHFASDRLAGLLCFSGFANTMSGLAMLKRQKLEIENATDGWLRGQMFSRDMEHFRR